MQLTQLQLKVTSKQNYSSKGHLLSSNACEMVHQNCSKLKFVIYGIWSVRNMTLCLACFTCHSFQTYRPTHPPSCGDFSRVQFVLQETEEDVLKHQLMSGGCSVSGISPGGGGGGGGARPQGGGGGGGRPVIHPGDVTVGLELLSNSFSWQALTDLGIDPSNITSQVFVANASVLHSLCFYT